MCTVRCVYCVLLCIWLVCVYVCVCAILSAATRILSWFFSEPNFDVVVVSHTNNIRTDSFSPVLCSLPFAFHFLLLHHIYSVGHICMCDEHAPITYIYIIFHWKFKHTHLHNTNWYMFTFLKSSFDFDANLPSGFVLLTWVFASYSVYSVGVFSTLKVCEILIESRWEVFDHRPFFCCWVQQKNSRSFSERLGPKK